MPHGLVCRNRIAILSLQLVLHDIHPAPTRWCLTLLQTRPNTRDRRPERILRVRVDRVCRRSQLI